MADNTLALEKLSKERADLERQRVTLKDNLIAVTGALQFADYLINAITKPEKPVEAENMNGAGIDELPTADEPDPRHVQHPVAE